MISSAVARLEDFRGKLGNRAPCTASSPQKIKCFWGPIKRIDKTNDMLLRLIKTRPMNTGCHCEVCIINIHTPTIIRTIILSYLRQFKKKGAGNEFFLPISLQMFAVGCLAVYIGHRVRQQIAKVLYLANMLCSFCFRLSTKTVQVFYEAALFVSSNRFICLLKRMW